MLMQNLGGQTKSIMVFSEMAYSKRVGREVPGVVASLKFVFKRLSVYKATKAKTALSQQMFVECWKH